MKKRFTLLLLAAFVAVASFAQPAKRNPERLQLLPVQTLKNLPVMKKPAKNVKAPRKTPVTVADVVGDYTVDMYDYIFKMSLIAGEKTMSFSCAGFSFTISETSRQHSMRKEAC